MKIYDPEIMIKYGPVAIDIMFDEAHNSGSFDFVDLTDKEWKRIEEWEHHLRECFQGYIDNLKYDLDKK